MLARMEDEYEWVRERVAEALGVLGDMQAVEPLLARLEDEEQLVRDLTPSWPTKDAGHRPARSMKVLIIESEATCVASVVTVAKN